MIRAYLLANAVLYVLFAAWCTLAPEKTASAIGLKLESPSGRSEFITVYGGLEMGLAVFFALAGLKPAMHEAGLLFALCLYGAITIWRVPTLVAFRGIGPLTFATAGLELVLAIVAGALWWTRTQE